MIVKGINGRHADLSYRVHQDLVDVLGPCRIEMIDEIVMGSIVRQLRSSFFVAQSGAMRWPVSMHPEVLIDATGRLL